MTHVLRLVTDSSRSVRSGVSMASGVRSMPSASTAPLDLERCLAIWGAWERGYRIGPQPVRVAIWAPHTDGHDAKAESQLSKSNVWVAQHTSKAIEALPHRSWKLVLEVEYVWNGNNGRVFRSNRLPSDAMVLAGMLDDAKQALLPILERRGLPVKPLTSA